MCSSDLGTHEQVTLEDIMARVKAAKFDAVAVRSREEGVAEIGKVLRADDAVLLLTSGNLGGLIEAVPEFAEKAFPA